jgi:hypothetical protein
MFSSSRLLDLTGHLSSVCAAGNASPHNPTYLFTQPFPADAAALIMSYNGIGLSTVRGSGTNGYVQKNKADLPKWREKVGIN